MRKRKLTLIFIGLATIVFLASGCGNNKKMKQLENEVVRLNQVILQKDTEIKKLTTQVKELDSTKKELRRANKELDTLKAKSGSLKK